MARIRESSMARASLRRVRISTDKAKLDLPLIHDFLSHSSYWAQGRSYEVVEQSIAHSLCFDVYDGSQQVGFARVVTDYATFAWVCDVFILDTYRGQGLSKWLVQCVTVHPDLQNVLRFVLATRDAHELYRQYGNFQPLANPEWWRLRTKTQ